MPRFKAETSISSSGKTCEKENTGYTSKRTDRDALGVHKVTQGGFHKLREVVRQMLVANIVQIIVVGVLRHPPIEIRPRQDILF